MRSVLAVLVVSSSAALPVQAVQVTGFQTQAEPDQSQPVVEAGQSKEAEPLPTELKWDAVDPKQLERAMQSRKLQAPRFPAELR
jgi:hypothetical protein